MGPLGNSYKQRFPLAQRIRITSEGFKKRHIASNTSDDIMIEEKSNGLRIGREWIPAHKLIRLYKSGTIDPQYPTNKNHIYVIANEDATPSNLTRFPRDTDIFVKGFIPKKSVTHVRETYPHLNILFTINNNLQVVQSVVSKHSVTSPNSHYKNIDVQDVVT